MANSKLTYGLKALGLLVVSVIFTHLLWSNISYVDIIRSSNSVTSAKYVVSVQTPAYTFTKFALVHMLFVISIFLFGSNLGVSIKELITFSLVHFIALIMTKNNTIPSNSYILHSLAPLTIVYISIENIYVKYQRKTRYIEMAVCGLIHGAAMAVSIKEMGLAMNHFGNSIFIYKVITCLTIPLLLILVNLASGIPYRKFLFKSLSVVLLLVGLYLAYNQIFL